MKYCTYSVSDSVKNSVPYDQSDLGRHNNTVLQKRLVENNYRNIVENQLKASTVLHILDHQVQLNKLIVQYMDLVNKSDQIFSSAVLRPTILRTSAAKSITNSTTVVVFTATYYRELILIGSVSAALAYVLVCTAKSNS